MHDYVDSSYQIMINIHIHSYPWEYVWYNDTNNKRTGVPVEMNVNFHRVFDVDIIGSVMDLIVWFRLKWADPRLAWEPNDFGGLNKTRVWIGDGGTGGETSEIWVPGMFLFVVYHLASVFVCTYMYLTILLYDAEMM